MIEIKNVTKTFGDFTAIEDLTMTVENSSIHGLVGYNGAGKTTLIKCIAGVYRPDGGEVLIDGRNTYSDPSSRSRLFYVPDEIFFAPYSSIEGMAKFYAGYYPAFSFETLDKLCKVFGLDKSAKLNAFSKGMQRQAELILGISTLPRVLLLDESFDGLDPQKRNTMNNMIVEYAAENDTCVLVSSHNLHEIADICDSVALINGKKIVLDCSIDEISEGRCRFRLIFDTEKSKDDFAAFDIRKFKSDGKMVTLSLSGNPDETEAALRAMKPVFIEKIPLTMEEIFLEEMEESDYDFKEIFG